MTASCAECRYQDRIIAKEIRRNERRLAAGQPAELDAIERAQADKRECADLGHTRGVAGQQVRA